jgi:hypothetical protein
MSEREPAIEALGEIIHVNVICGTSRPWTMPWCSRVGIMVRMVVGHRYPL